MTQLCEIPGCRIRGRHLPGCGDEKCTGCLPRLAEDGLVCEADIMRTYERLDEIRGVAGDALLVAYGFARTSADGGGGKPGSRSPANDDALDALDEVGNALTTLVREIADAQRLSAPLGGLGVGSTIRTAAKWLSGQMQWLRGATDDQGGAYAAGVFPEIADCASRMRGIVNGPTPGKYLGPCGAWYDTLVTDEAGTEMESRQCDGDVYGRAGADKGTCRTCGAQVDQGERRVWLDDVRREWLYHASEIADAYPIKAGTIRQWLNRGLLIAHGEHEGRPLLKLGEVLDLAAGDAARREEARAARARRKEAAA